jgi:sensor histidine kinase YesM
MILQPVVENAVNYGIRDIDYEGKIFMAVYHTEDQIEITIEDNGTGMDQSTIDRVMNTKLEDNAALKERNITKDSNGIGLGNVINRLRLYYDREEVFIIESEGKFKGTKVTIYLPFNTRK